MITRDLNLKFWNQNWNIDTYVNRFRRSVTRFYAASGRTVTVPRVRRRRRSRKGSPMKAEFDIGSDAPVKKVDDDVTKVAKIVMKHRDLKEIMEAVKENFEKATIVEDQLLEMLEVRKAHLDRNDNVSKFSF
ncbi:hypothetical protein JHK85_056823 [Glycine max]|nr:hypothetical protein JHK85_056823 [Glycine max]